MRFFTLFLLIFSFSIPAKAQYRTRSGSDDCPQGRIIRQKQAIYPPTMTDCQVLDVDTAVENAKIRKRTEITRPLPKHSADTAPPLASPTTAATTGAAPKTEEAPHVAAQQFPADYENRPIGNWLITAKQDRFGDGGTFLAITADENGLGFGVRCIQRHLSIGILVLGGDPRPMEKGDLYKIKFKVDDQPIVDSAGVAIDQRLIQVVTEQSLVKAVRDGKETAVRLQDPSGVVSTHIFDNNGARRAFADLSKECPID